jgi:DNA-binding response OmpR family regulator
VSEITEVISDNLRLKRRAQIAYLDDKPLNLSPKAFQILEYLMLHRDEVISRERFMEVLWDITSNIGTRAVDVRIAELRRELGDKPGKPRFIKTVSGQGYRFIGPVEVVS